MTEDIELLRSFARDRSEAAFGELVRRHIDLVYAFALRRVNGDAHLADDVTQCVFADLARKASELRDRSVLTSWLYTSTRFAAAKAVRSEQRRRTHEQEAHSMQELHPEPAPAWEQIRPVLDNVMDQLNEPDREAILLRFFESRPLAEIGRRLSVSEDAARMRIDRALEKTRALLARHGITSTSAALSAALAAHTTLAAPAGLASTVTTGALALLTKTGTGAVALEATKNIAMTTLHKVTLVSALTLALGAGLYEARALQLQSQELDTARTGKSSAFASLQRSTKERADANRQLGAIREQIAKLQASASASKGGADAALEGEMRAWYAREAQLRQAFATNPQWQIPELQLLTASDWFAAAQDTRMETPEEVRETLGKLRGQAKNKLAEQTRTALQAYLAAHDDMLPEDPGQLAPYYKLPIDPAILDRYETVRRGKLADLPKNTPGIVMREKDAADLEFDLLYQIGVTGVEAVSALEQSVEVAKRAFAGANGGQNATNAAQLMPYLKVPVDPVKLTEFLK